MPETAREKDERERRARQQATIDALKRSKLQTPEVPKDTVQEHRVDPKGQPVVRTATPESAAEKAEADKRAADKRAATPAPSPSPSPAATQVAALRDPITAQTPDITKAPAPEPSPSPYPSPKPKPVPVRPKKPGEMTDAELANAGNDLSAAAERNRRKGKK